MIAPDNQQERLGDYLAGIRRRGVVRSRADLIRSVIPFFERHPILSEKRLEFETFAEIVRAMERLASTFRRRGSSACWPWPPG